MTETKKIQGKFYPLQHEEWVRACRELTPAERDVLYFVRTLDPYGDGLDVSTAEIARQLSSDRRTVHRSTVSRALKALDAKGFIDLELLTVKLNVKAKGVHCCDEATSCDETTSCDEATSCDETTVLSGDNKRDPDTTSAIVTQQARSPRNNQPPEPPPDKGSKTPKTNKTHQTKKISLSEREREKFLKFGLKKARELPKPPALPEKWVWANFDELYRQFGNETEESAASEDWASHPQREEWIAQIRQGRPRFVAQGGPSEEWETRRQFAEWAEANNLVWGVRS